MAAAPAACALRVLDVDGHDMAAWTLMIGLLICLGWETFGTVLAFSWLNRRKRIRRMEPALVARVVLVSLMIGAIWPALIVGLHMERKLWREVSSWEETEAAE